MASTSASNTKAEQKARGASIAEETPSCFVDTHGVITSTKNDLPGYRIVKVLGTIYGITVRSRNWGADIGAFLKSSVGGEIKYFTNLMYSSRNAAIERLVGECMERGGNAVIALRFDQGEVSREGGSRSGSKDADCVRSTRSRRSALMARLWSSRRLKAYCQRKTIFKAGLWHKFAV
jgi:uncharacterized protein YbjQ (UPF0145 family)